MIVLISSFFEINFKIKTSDKIFRRFDLAENDCCIKESNFPNLLTNRRTTTLTIYYPVFHPVYLLNLVRKGMILASGKGTSRIPFRTEKVDYLWRLSTISEKIFQKIAFPFDLKPKFLDFLVKW